MEATDAESELEASEAYADALFEACEGLGVHPYDVVSYRVYEDRVVIIEGPVGYKRVWWRE